jgi:hypothetical protein
MEHDCEFCTYLGTTGPTTRFGTFNAIDHYVCVRSDFRKSDLTQRFGSDGPDYGSFSLEIVEMAFRDMYGDTLELLYKHPVYHSRQAE